MSSNASPGDDLWDSYTFSGSTSPYVYEDYRDGSGYGVNEFTGNDWEILAYGEMEFQGDDFCIGVLRYTTIAEGWGIEDGNRIEKDNEIWEGWAYGYWATPIGNIDCFDSDDYIGMDRPGLLFLHGYGGRGSFRNAARMARVASTSSVPVFALSISGPGQGYNCNTLSPKVGLPPECEDNVTILDWIGSPEGLQFSHGDKMAENSDRTEDRHGEFTEGIPADSSDPYHPDFTMLWGYAMSEMRAITLFKDDNGLNSTSLNWVSDELIIGGFSAGGVTTLLVNGIDSRPDGAYAIASAAGFDKIFNTPGSWTNMNLADQAGETPAADMSFNCASPPSEDYQKKACNLMDYFEQTLFTQQNDLLLAVGSQDESYSYASIQYTLENMTMDTGKELYLHYQADMDHAN